MSGCGTQLLAALRKTLTQKRRRPGSFLCEILLPILFLVGMVAVSRTSKTELMPARNFVDNNFTDFNQAGFEPTAVKPYVCLKLDNTAFAASPVASVFPQCADGATVYELGTDPEGGPTAIEFEGFATTREPSTFVWSYLGKFEQARLVTDLDESILVRYVARRVLSWTVRTQWWEPAAALANLGRIYVSPPGAAADALIAQLKAASSLFEHVLGGAMDEDEAVQYARDDHTAANVWGIIVLDQFDASGMNVKLRFNQTVLPFSSSVRSRYGDSNGLGTHRTELWMASGFSTFQTLVSEAYLSIYFGGAAAGTDRQALAPMPYAAYMKNDFLTGAGGLLPLAIVLGFLYPVSQLTRLLVEEKELRVREAMMIMGLGNFAFYLSWLIPYIGMHVFISIVITIIVKATFMEHSNGGIIFFLFFFFGLSCIGLSVLLSSFFSKARVAALVSPVVFFLLAIPSFALSDDAPANTKRGLLILGPSAFSFGSKLLFDYELIGGFHGKDLNNKFDDVKMIAALVMLVVDAALYLLLGLYFEAVLPSDWGVPVHPLLCLGPAFTRMRNAVCGCRPRRHKAGTSVVNAEGVRDGRDQKGAFEPRSNAARPTVRFLGLRKDFDTPSGTIRAVNDLTLDLYENDISVLLGHNGAGKTTAISLITGMLPMTEGDCIVYGASVRNDLAAVRQRIGYCPQHNILWPELTCREHLRFYCALKGLTGSPAEKQINILLAAVDLSEKADAFSKGLSGGQKRKLSVAIAFCGGAKLIFLDEPTAGMDVAARRFTWDLVRRMSAGRTIVLTTHFMDEADLLGHTINIMSQGRLKCQGSSTFLKARLGVGYTLSVVLAPEFQSAASNDNIVRLAKSYVSESAPLHGSAAEVRIRLPTHQVAHFAPLLAALETRSAEFGVSGFGISVTTLEEVFMRIADEGEHREDEDSDPAGETALVPMGASAPSADSVAVGIDGASAPPPATKDAATAKSLASVGASAPSANSVAVSIDSAPPAPTASATAKTSRSVEPIEPIDARELYHPDELARADVPFRVQLRVLMTKRFHTGRRDKRTIVLQIIVPIICLILAMLLANVKYPSQPALNLAPSSYGSVESAVSSDCSAAFTAITQSGDRMVDSGRAGAGAFSQYLLDTFYGHADERVASFACPSSATSPAVPVVFSNESFPSGGAYALAQYNILQIRATANVHAEMYHYPMPLSNSAQAIVDSLTAVIVGIMILVPFTFIPSIYAAFIVKEREVHAKHLQQVSGMQFLPYWVSNFIFDFFSFLITDILALIVFAIFNRKEYIGSGDAAGATIMLLLMYTVSSIMMAYAVSFLFDSHATAQNVIMMANFVAGFILVLMVFILGFIDSTKDAADPLRYVLRIVPAFSLGDGLIKLATLQSYRRSIPDAPSAFSVDWIGLNILYMGALTPAFALLTLFLDHPNGSASISRWFRNTCGTGSDDNSPAAAAAASCEPDDDVDVLREKQEVESGARDRDLVVVKKLHKRFGEKVAVRDLSFGIHHGEVFAFLGTNGAGKTTTISILCGELTPTSGSGWIAGKNVEADMTEVRQQIGYCPQFDALLELLTVEEHLYLISGLRGIPAGPVQDRVVQRLIRMCDLTRHSKKTAGSLSGGNKRKLSVAIALIGAPKVVFLDEPSAGMDPMARHGMWDVIENLSKACCVVLTTHHLEEVEALADRVAIMVAGSLRCLGSLQHLKTKFGSGFELTMRLESESHVPAVSQFISATIPTATLQEERLGKITYALPPDAKLSAVFASVEQRKAELHILDYTVSQTSLEQVFLRIGADAFHEEE